MNEIEYLEATELGVDHNAPNLPIDYVKEFLRKATLLNEWMALQHEDYIGNLIDRTYADSVWNIHSLKKHVILSYPMIAFETILKPEKVAEYRKIQTGLYPFERGREINACACKLRNGDTAIFFSEWLFSFLWDYYCVGTSVIPDGTKHGDLTEEDKLKLKEKQSEVGQKLFDGVYSNWKFEQMMNTPQTTNSFKIDQLFALLYIHGHELGHIYLNHLNSNSLKKSKHLLSNSEPVFLETYTPDQIQEFDADMFASDLYFHYLYSGITIPDKNAFKHLHVVGFEFLRLLARVEEKEDWRQFFTSEHPPSGVRLLFIYLRHKDKLLNAGFDFVVEASEKAISTGKGIPHYDYNKDLGVSNFVR